MSRGGKNIFSQYDYENTTKALEAVRVGMSIRQTSIEIEVQVEKLCLYTFVYTCIYIIFFNVHIDFFVNILKILFPFWTIQKEFFSLSIH
jgi:hypothetical protein